jgi:hypothetical protein
LVLSNRDEDKLGDPPYKTAREMDNGNGHRKWKPETETGNGNQPAKSLPHEVCLQLDLVAVEHIIIKVHVIPVHNKKVNGIVH